MNRRGVIEKLSFHGVLAEASDGAQPTSDGGPGPATGYQVAGKAPDVRPAEGGDRGRERWPRSRLLR